MSDMGAKPVTIYTVAQRAGVSIATVSRVLQGTTPTTAPTRKKVLDAVEELGYVPLRSGRASSLRLETHGLVLPSVSGPYYSELLTGFWSTSSEFGQSIIVLSARDVTDLDTRVIDLAGKADGLVIGHATVDDEVVADVARRVPVVLVSRSALPGCDAFTVENMEPTIALVQHVLSHGRRHPRFVGDPSGSRDVARRYAGFLQALSEAGLQDPLGPIRVPLEESSGRTAAARMLASSPRADALVCANDEVALATMTALAEHGVRCPDDVAITGWDDIMSARYSSPALTTVRQQAEELGHRLSQRLHERIVTEVTPQPLVSLSSEVVLRNSCGCH